LKEKEDVGGDRGQLEAFLLAYFDAQYELLQRFKPEIVGHLDLCRLYTPDLKFMDFQEVWKRIERNVEYAISYGALFEVNAAAFRKKWKTAYPGPDVAQVGFHPPLTWLEQRNIIFFCSLYFNVAGGLRCRTIATDPTQLGSTIIEYIIISDH